MGINIFVEGAHIKPAEIKLVLSRKEIVDFQYLERMLKSLRYTDEVSKIIMDECWNLPKNRLQRIPTITRLKMESPFELVFSTDPAWLAVFFTILCGYKQAKESMTEIRYDIGALINNIKGLSDYELELLRISIDMTLDRLRQLLNIRRVIRYKFKFVQNWFTLEKRVRELEIRLKQSEAAKTRKKKVKVCKVKGCKLPVRSKGYCVEHYPLWRKRTSK